MLANSLFIRFSSASLLLPAATHARRHTHTPMPINRHIQTHLAHTRLPSTHLTWNKINVKYMLLSAFMLLYFTSSDLAQCAMLCGIKWQGKHGQRIIAVSSENATVLYESRGLSVTYSFWCQKWRQQGRASRPPWQPAWWRRDHTLHSLTGGSDDHWTTHKQIRTTVSTNNVSKCWSTNSYDCMPILCRRVQTWRVFLAKAKMFVSAHLSSAVVGINRDGRHRDPPRSRPNRVINERLMKS